MIKQFLLAAILISINTATAQPPDAILSFELDKKLFKVTRNNSVIDQRIKVSQSFVSSNISEIEFYNLSGDTIELRNVVPYGVSEGRVYITGMGEHGLSRTHLFVPGKQPVNVICPDNAWELGATFLQNLKSSDTAALIRRDRNSLQKGQRRRFETILYPGGSVKYRLYKESFRGDWQEGLRVLFQQKYLYDLESFDNNLFERKDLQWIRHSYVMHLMQAWDKFFYDAGDKKFHLLDFIERGKKLYGGDEVIGIWPTWPSLGLDQRNQFDLFRDLPGGTTQLRKLSAAMRNKGTKFFICYNPWDESTRSEGHLAGLGDLIKVTAADGVVLDTRGASSKELQDAADNVRAAVVMYSEGMAVPKDMPGIVSGRVHNALYYPPMLNLNKFIKPEFAIFRVAELYKEPIQREFATSFFNGYGTEINMFAPGQPDWVIQQYKYLGKTSRILRENTFNFTSGKYTPLLATTDDSIWVNQWELSNKTIYTIYSTRSQGYKGNLFAIKQKENFHFVDLWHHKLLNPIKSGEVFLIEAETNSFHKKYLGTNNEGEVDCIAQLPILIQSNLNGDVLKIKSSGGTKLKLWAGSPSYEKSPLLLKTGTHIISVSQSFGRFEGDIIIQLFEEDILLDETIVSIKPGTPRLTSAIAAVQSNRVAQTDEVIIPAGKFIFKETHGDEFISYPKQFVDSGFDMPSFRMDKYPVTNAQFKKFIVAAKYKPRDTVNYLKHWQQGSYKKGEENFPVIYISYEDAQAYAKWAGKRLPTEIEWQYAAQTSQLNEWPWQQTTPVKRKEEIITESLTVTSIEGIDSSKCNLGDGKLYPVGKYPAGANTYGLHDLVGCVWQLTNDVYTSGSYRYIILKGGCYFKPSSSWWYVQSGPRELHYRQFLLRVSEGFERNGTVGFRCVR